MMHLDFDWGCLWLCLLTFAIIHNMAESSITSFTGLIPSFLLFLFTSHTGKIATDNDENFQIKVE